MALLPPILTVLVGVGLGAFASSAGRLFSPRSYRVSMTVWIGPSPAKRLVCAVRGHKWRYYWDAEYAEPGYEDLCRECTRCELNTFAGGQTRRVGEDTREHSDA